MPTAYCSIADAYGSDFGMKRKNVDKLPANYKQVVDKPTPKKEDAIIEANEKRLAKYGKAPEGQPYNCPYCNNCNAANNKFQQNVSNQAVWPRPRWIPQDNNDDILLNAPDQYKSNNGHIQQYGDPYASRYFNSGVPTGANLNVLNSYYHNQAPVIEKFGNFQYPYYNNYGGVEHFGNGVSGSNGENLLKVILWLLIALFIIQLVDMIIKLVTSC
jgi:hypothetical protein